MECAKLTNGKKTQPTDSKSRHGHQISTTDCTSPLQRAPLGRVSMSAARRIQTSIDTIAFPTRVWSVLTDPAYPTWNPFIQSVSSTKRLSRQGNRRLPRAISSSR